MNKRDWNYSFNPRPRMGGDSASAPSIPSQPMFQSTPPHGGRLIVNGIDVLVLFVSIHAPAWGATTSEAQQLTRYVFQSTPPHGGRRNRHTDSLRATSVSIHAPAWGATQTIAQNFLCNPRFNPRPRMGGDCERNRHYDHIAWFQSTPPHGGRLGISHCNEACH